MVTPFQAIAYCLLRCCSLGGGTIWLWLQQKVFFCIGGGNVRVETTPGGAAPKAGADVAEYQKDLLEKVRLADRTT